MSCKLKKWHTDKEGKQCEKPYCKFTNGECQFVKEGSETACPIHGTHKDAQ